MELRRGLMMGMGGKARMSSGEFFHEDTSPYETITHNLGTTAIFFVAQRVNDDHSNIDSSNRYKTLFLYGATSTQLNIDQQQTYSYNGGNQTHFDENGTTDGPWPEGLYAYFGTTTATSPNSAVLNTPSWLFGGPMIEPVSSNEVTIRSRYALLSGRWVWRAYALG